MPEESKLTRSSLDSMIPSNAKTAKPQESQERKKLAPVVKGKVSKQKKSVGQKFKEAFLGDTTKSVSEYLLYDILVPTLKNMLSEMISGGTDMFLFGERRRGSSPPRNRAFSSYDKYYQSSANDKAEPNRNAKVQHDFDDIVFDSRGEAEAVLSSLVDLTIEYGQASVMNFYDLSGVPSSYVDDGFGWSNLRSAYTDRIRNGYVIRFPSVKSL